MRKLFLIIGFFTGLEYGAQISIEGLVKEKAGEVKDKAKEKARKKAIEQLEKQKKDYDESNFNYAISFLDNSGSFEAAEKGNALSSTVLNLAKISNNEERSTEDRAYSNLKNGELLMAGNKYHLAEQSFRLSKFLYEEDGKTGTANYSQVLNDLGLLYQVRGLFNKSQPHHEKALELRKSASGGQGMLIVSENNLAVLKKETGLYLEAEKLLKNALLKAMEQKDKLAQGLIHNNLAMVYLDMNKMKDAENQMHSSLSEASVVLKETSSNFIKLQINLANIYRFEKKFISAEEIYLRAISIKEKNLGAHPDLAHLKKGLAQLYLEMGRVKDAEKLLLNALEIYKKKLGETNPATVSTQHELANYYRITNNPVKALELMTKVVESKKEIYGQKHPNYIQAVEDLAIAQWENNKNAEAGQNYQFVMNNTLDYIQSFFKSLNEAEKTQYWDKTSARLQRYFSFLLENCKNNELLVKDLYNMVINTKGFLLNNSAKIRSNIFSGSDEALKQDYKQWLATKEQLNHAYQLTAAELLEEGVNMDSLTTRVAELERELSRKSGLFKESLEKTDVTLENVQTQLKPNEAAIEIVKLNEFKNGFTGNDTYLGLILKPKELKLVNIGTGKDLEAAVTNFREKVINLQPEKEAYARAWKVVDDELKAVTKIFVSFDGCYHQLSLAGIRDGSGKFLADRYSIEVCANTMDLIDIKQNESNASKPGSAFLIGNPLYGKSDMIEQLPGTETEVKKITKLLLLQKVKTIAHYGDKATETKVKEINSPSILHFATHGYFLEDLSQMESNKILGVDLNAAKENPLLRSGLLFAGCENVFDENFHPPPNSENGVLTAYEAMSLQLDKTDLVVLSACQTGMGSVKQGEGVYGLQRAFLIAGVKSIIMSLWNVSDDATMQLMTLFYTNYIKTGKKNQAFNDAVKQLKLKYKEPYYWAAFVMLSR